MSEPLTNVYDPLSQANYELGRMTSNPASLIPSPFPFYTKVWMRCLPSGDQQHLPSGLAALEEPVRLGCFGKGVRGSDAHIQLPGCYPFEEVSGPLQQLG